MWDSKGNSCHNQLYQKRQVFHNKIRKQYIQEYTKNKRKQLLQGIHPINFNPKQSLHNQFYKGNNEYIDYLQVFTYEVFVQQPNNHLLFLVEILLCQDCYLFKKYYTKMIKVIARYITQKFAEATHFLQNLESTNTDFNQINTQLISKIFIYDQIFFNPIPKTSTYHIRNITCNASNVKLSIDLLLEFLMALIYVIHPETFSFNEYCQQFEERKPYNNGYGQIDQSNQSVMNNLYITIDSFLAFSMDLIQMSYCIKHQKIPLRALQKLFTQHNYHLKYLQMHPQVESLCFPFSFEQCFLSTCNSMIILSKSLTLVMNISSLIEDKDHKVLQFFVNRNVLADIQYFSTTNPTSNDQKAIISEIYQNLVQFQIVYFKNKHERKSNRNIQQNHIQQNLNHQENQKFNNNPGVYVQLLNLLVTFDTDKNCMQQICCILLSIFTHYEVPVENQHKIKCIDKNIIKDNGSHELILVKYQCEKLSQALTSFLNAVHTNDMQLMSMGDLFIEVCTKFLSHMLYINRLIYMLQTIIRNQSKQILMMQTKRQKHKYLPTSTSGSILSFDLPKQLNKNINVYKQNIMRVVDQCSALVQTNFIREKQEQKAFSDQHMFQSASFDFQHISQQIVQCLLALYQEVQIQHICKFTFLDFIAISIQCYPNFFVDVQTQSSLNKKNTQTFMYFLQQLQINDKNDSIMFVRILNLLANHLNQQKQSSKKKKLNVYCHLNNYRNLYDNLLQKLEGQMNSSQYIDQFMQVEQFYIKHTQDTYQLLKKLMDEASEQLNQQMQIQK